MSETPRQYDSTMPVVAFDLDGTLTVRDCVLPFMRIISGRAIVPRTLVKRAPKVVASVVRRDRDATKAIAINECFSGKSVDIVTQRGAEFADRIASAWMRTDTLARLRWHQSQGHRVVIVSASLDPYVVPLAQRLGVDDVLCTRLDSQDGVLTGGLLGENCRGAAKVTQLKEWGNHNGYSGDQWLTHAYGDTRGDRHMLAFAENGFFVRYKEIDPAC